MVADTFPDSPPRSGENMHGLVAGIKAFTLWLGGALAGISAMLYATGYLVTRAHLNLLGLYGIVDFGHDYFIQEGSKFYLVIGYSYVLGVVLPLLAIAGIAAVGFRVLAFALQKAHVQPLMPRLAAILARFEPGGSLRIAAFAVLLIVFLLDADKFLVEFQVPLCVSNLLYADRGSLDAACDDQMQAKKKVLEAAILHRNINVASILNERFSTLVYATAKTAFLVYLMWRVALPWRRWRLWLVAPVMVALCFYAISLPLDYAVLQRPVIYPRISLALSGEPAPATNGPLFLLSKTASDFVIWDASARRLLWIPSGGVKRLEVVGVGDLFSDQQGGPADRERNK
jgi:hypothetical protein